MSATRLISGIFLVSVLHAQGMLVRGSGGGGGVTCPTPTRLYDLTEGTGTTIADTGSDGDTDGDFGSTAPTWESGSGNLVIGTGAWAQADTSPLVRFWDGAAGEGSIPSTDNTICTSYKVSALGTRYGIAGEGVSNNEWRLGGSINASYIAELFIQAGGSSARLIQQFGASPATGTWYFVCVGMPADLADSTVTRYINGSSVAVGAQPTNTLASPDVLTYGSPVMRLGTSNTSIHNSSNGQTIGWTAIWENDLLSADEVAACCADADTSMGGALTCP